MSVCLISRCRNERNILEWISYHLEKGMDHIIIYDDLSTIPVANIVYPTFTIKQCTIIKPQKRLQEISGHAEGCKQNITV